MKIVITTIVSLNPGDAAILDGTLMLLRGAFGDDIDVTVLDHQGGAAERYYPWAKFAHTLFGRGGWGWIRRRFGEWGYTHRVIGLDRWRFELASRVMDAGLGILARRLLTRSDRESLEAYHEADLVVASGGTYLVEHYNLETPLLEYELILGMGRPLVFFPQSMGPFENTPYRDRLRRVFQSSNRVFVRDDRSAAHLRDLGVSGEVVELAPDAAFALARPDMGAPGMQAAGREHRVAVSVREWKRFGEEDPEVGRTRYLRSVAEAVARLVAEGMAVTFVSTCQGIPEYWTDDAKVADEVVALLPPEVAASTRVDRTFRHPREMREMLGGYRAVIATRMHAAILALSAGVPVLGIAYEFKTSELFRELGLEAWTVEIGKMEPARFSDLASRFVREAPALRPKVTRGVRALRQRLDAMVRALTERAPHLPAPPR